MTKWLTIEDFIDVEFFREPRAVTVTAPNGTGKTTSLTRLTATLYNLRFFDRGYIVFFAHEISDKVINILRRNNVNRIVYFKGIDRVCINKKLLNEVVELGLPPSFACSICSHNIFNFYKVGSFEDRLKFTADWIEKFFREKDVLDPTRERIFSIKEGIQICIQPLVKTVAVYPQLDNYLRSTLIVLTPYAIFSTKPIINRWREFHRRQRLIRKYFAFFDECDTLIYSGFIYKISRPDFTDFDRKVLEELSTKTIKLTKFIEFYNRLFSILEQAAYFEITPDETCKYVNELFNKYNRVLRRLGNVLDEICRKAWERKEKTFLVNAYTELSTLENFTEAMARSIDKVGENIIVQDIDFTYRILYDITFPFRYWWKLSTTATFPSREIFLYSRLIEQAKEVINYVTTIDIYPENVYIFTFVLFPELLATGETLITPISRNEEVEARAEKIIELLFKSIELYRNVTGLEPRGILLFFGNKTQYYKFKNLVQDYVLHDLDTIFTFKIRKYIVWVTYCASSFSRGLDFSDLDISIVISPLIRPPRAFGTVDSLDVGRAMSEAIQSLFRIVRSLRPDRPKFIGIEANLLYKRFYQFAMASWFRKLVEECILERRFFRIQL